MKQTSMWMFGYFAVSRRKNRQCHGRIPWVSVAKDISTNAKWIIAHSFPLSHNVGSTVDEESFAKSEEYKRISSKNKNTHRTSMCEDYRVE